MSITRQLTITTILVFAFTTPHAHSASTTGQTPLHRAVSQGDTRKIGELLHAGADLDALDGAGATPFELAGRTSDTVKAIVDAYYRRLRKNVATALPDLLNPLRDLMVDYLVAVLKPSEKYHRVKIYKTLRDANCKVRQ